MLIHNIEQALVLEDDVAFEKNFKEAIALIDKFPSHWDFSFIRTLRGLYRHTRSTIANQFLGST